MSKVLFILHLVCLTVFASAQSVDFTFQSSTGFCNPAIVQFTQKCTGNPTSFHWTLGNGVTTQVANPSTSYTNAGTYTVTLVAVYQEVSLEVSKTITITPAIVANINPDKDFICKPGTINLSVTSSAHLDFYNWDFGDGVKANSPTGDISHPFTYFGTFNVILRASNISGCVARDTIKINVKKPVITAKMDTSSGCLPANVNFTAAAEVAPNSTVSSYAWNFGDGSVPVTTQTGNVSYSYTTTDSVRPSVIITTNEGCVDTLKFRPAAFGFVPGAVTAYATNDTLCGSETFVFVAKAENATGYRWDFGDGVFSTVRDTIVKHKYTTLGTKKVTVTPLFNGCPGIAASFNIRIIGVIARFTFQNNCLEKQTFTFSNTSLGNKQFIKWEFGDGSPDVFTNNVIHSYPTPGQFITNLTVADSITGCMDTFSRPIYTAKPILVNPDATICVNTSTSFTIADNYLNPQATYTWTLVGRQVNTNLIPRSTLTASILGNFDNSVVIRNGTGYCRDTVYLDHKILVRGPQLDFILPSAACFTDSTRITNNSKPFIAGDSITTWIWNYGTGSTNDSVFEPAPFVYNSVNVFPVKLTAQDINGCKSELTKKITINPLPFLQLVSKADTLCVGHTDTLIAFHSGQLLWGPSGSVSCTTCDTTLVNPQATTTYYATAMNAFNCSIRDSIVVNIFSSFTASPGISDQNICAGEQVILDANPKGKEITWTSSGGSFNTSVYNPTVKPTQTTIYTATLKDSSGCSSAGVATITVFVKPLPTVDAGPDQRIDVNTPFTLNPSYSPNIVDYLWSPAGTLTCIDCANPAGVAMQEQLYTVSVTSDSGCVANDSVRISIKQLASVFYMPTAFTPNNDNLNDVYYPIATGVSLFTRFAIYNREGSVMYERTNFSPANSRSVAWNGEYKGSKLPPRAYLYLIEAVDEQGKKVTKAGSFLLIR